MSIKAMPLISEPLYLQDVELTIKLMEREGEQECPRDLQAYIIVRQPTEGDMMRLNELTSEDTIEYSADGSVRTKQEPRDQRDAWRVFLCMAGAGNLLAAEGDAPLFLFDSTGSYPRVKGEFDDFMKAWRTLPDVVSNTITYLVNSANTVIWGGKGEAAGEGRLFW